MNGLDQDISRFSHRIRICLFALLAVIAVATVFALTLEKGTVWLGVDGINLGVTSGEEENFNEGVASDDTAEWEEDRGEHEEWGDHLEWVGLTLLLITASFYGLLIFQLERLFAAYQRGELFSQANARRIRNVGLLFFAAAAIAVIESLTELYVMQEFVAASLDDNAEDSWELVQEIRVPVPILLGGLAIVLIARVMEKGAQLQDEMDHLI